MLAPNFERMPPELCRLPRWVTHRAKVPYDPSRLSSKASSTDPATWGSFEQAEAAYLEGERDGVGHVLAGDGVVGIDLDHVVTNGLPMPAAMELLSAVKCQFVEMSPSGTGLHGWGYWPEAFPGRRGRIGDVPVEIYSRGRFLTVTGHPLPGLEGPLMPLNLAPVFEGLGSHLQKEQKMTEESSVPYVPSVASVEIPAHTLPAGEGERNKQLFHLARYLKGKYPGVKADDMRPMVQEWHRLALPNITTKQFDVSWADFKRGWAIVKQPHGATLNGILKTIDDAAPLPAHIEAKGYEVDTLRLVRVCVALQSHEGDGRPFFISARQAGELLGIHFTAASSLLALLVADGVMELVRRGAGRVASRYRMR